MSCAKGNVRPLSVDSRTVSLTRPVQESEWERTSARPDSHRVTPPLQSGCMRVAAGIGQAAGCRTRYRALGTRDSRHERQSARSDSTKSCRKHKILFRPSDNPARVGIRSVSHDPRSVLVANCRGR